MSCKSKGIRRARAATTTTHTYIPMMMKSSHGMIGASARIREAGSDLIFDECIAYLQSEQGEQSVVIVVGLHHHLIIR